MKKTVVLTHTEILCLAIRTAADEWQKERDKIKAMRKVDSALSRAMEESPVWKNKLQKLLELYELETGTEYGYDFGLEEGDPE